MTRRQVIGIALAIGTLVAAEPRLKAQSLGTLSWQLQPFCNVVTVNVTQQGTVYTIDGYDDQCGAPQRAPLVGLATPNPDGSIGFGLHVVTVPGGRVVQIDARISLASLGGPWTDSAGNSGTFVFGASAGGSPRPAPTVPGSAIALGSITAAQLAPGAAQAPVTGVCEKGQAFRGVNPNGSVVCSDALTTADDTPNDIGNDSSMAIGTDGLPIISHRDDTFGALRVTHCGNAACTAGNISTTVNNPANSVGTLSSIAIGADGLPVISHRDSTAGALRVTHCGNISCTSGNVTTTVDDPANSVGAFTSIAIGVDGLPIVSHTDVTAVALRVTHCGNVACTSGNSSVTAATFTGGAGRYTSIAIGADGLPVISYQAGASTVLRVTHCGNLTCSAGNVSTTVDSVAGSNVGYSTSIAIGVDGLPVMSHQDDSLGTLRVVHCGNVTCTAGNFASTADAPGSPVGYDSSIAIGSDGLPIISHTDLDALALRVTHCGSLTCNARSTVSTLVDNPENAVGYGTSIAIGADGLPVISHHDATANTLKVAKCGTLTCQ